MRGPLLCAALAVAIRDAAAVRRADPMAALLEAASSTSSDQCDSLLAAIDQLASTFSCVRDKCGGERPPPPTPPAGGGHTNPPPTPPPSGGQTSTGATQPTTKSNPGPTAPQVTGEVQVGTYVPNWFVYSKHYMGVDKIGVNGTKADGDPDPSYTYWAKQLVPLAPELTHVYYAFWDLDEQCRVVDADPDASWYGKGKDAPSWIKIPTGSCKGLMNDMMSVKAQFPHLKLLVSVGGWTYSQQYTHCAANADGRAKFYKSAAFLLNGMDSNWGKPGAIWDGIDLDWEFPASGAGLHPDHAEDDWERFVDLINDLRSAAHAEGRSSIILSSAIGVGETLSKLAAKPATCKAFCEALDHFNLMSYDIHGKWDPTTGHNAPFCWDSRSGNPSQKIWVAQVIDKLYKSGCPMHKMMLGLPNYAPAWTGIEAGEHGNGLFTKSTQAGGAFATWSTFSDHDTLLIPQGQIMYWDLKDTLAKDSSFKLHSWNCPEDAGVTVPIKHVYSATKKAWGSLDDEEVVAKKCEWARKKGMGGFFFWDAQQDKRGDLLRASRKGWGGLPTHAAKGSAQCFDNKKPDFVNDPLTGQPPPKICALEGSGKIKQGTNGVTTCSEAKAYAMGQCGGQKAYPNGSFHDGSPDKCIRVCSDTWGNGDDMMFPGDTIFFRCAGEPVPPSGGSSSGSGSTGGSSSGGGSSGGSAPKDMPWCDKSCKSCVPTAAGVSGSVSADQCQQNCVVDGVTWWPCDKSTTQLCGCAS